MRSKVQPAGVQVEALRFLNSGVLMLPREGALPNTSQIPISKRHTHPLTAGLFEASADITLNKRTHAFLEPQTCLKMTAAGQRRQSPYSSQHEPNDAAHAGTKA